MKLKKIKTFIIFIILTAIWSGFFGMYKYYVRTSAAGGLDPSLELLAGYLSVGSFIAFLVGGAVSYAFQERFIIFLLGVFTIIFILLGYFTNFFNDYILFIVIVFIGFFYGLWAVVRNVLVSIEIQKTGFNDTFVNAIVTIAFIVALIVGGISGGFLFEQFGNDGIWFIVFMMVFMCWLSVYLKYEKFSFKILFSSKFKVYMLDKQHRFSKSFKAYLPNMKIIAKRYSIYILAASFILAISTILSQKAIEMSVIKFGLLNSEAAFLLLYSSVGAIIGNFVTMKMSKNRWFYFRMFLYCFAVLIILFPIVSYSYENIVFLATLAGFFFGATLNLVESFFFLNIGKEDHKEYGASAYGVYMSIIVAIMMFLVGFVERYLGFDFVFRVMGLIIATIGIWFRFLTLSRISKKHKKGKI